MSLAWMSSVIDWDTCKIQYEILGDPLDRVAIVHGIPLSSVKRIAEDEGWVQLDPKAADLSSYVSKVIETHQAKLALAALYRDMELFPRVIEAEGLLLDKVIQAIKDVDPGAKEAAASLRALGQGLNGIADRKLIETYGPAEGADPEDTVWSVEVKKAQDTLTLVEDQVARRL